MVTMGGGTGGGAPPPPRVPGGGTCSALQILLVDGGVASVLEEVD